MFKPIVYGLPSQDYHAIDALSASGLKRLRRAPWAYKAPLLGDAPPQTPNALMANGTLVHTLALEPDQFPLRYAVGPEVPRTTKTWKEFAASMQGLELIKPSEYQAALRQADALRSIEDVAPLLATGQPEVSCFWTEEVILYDEGGAQIIVHVPCKMRADWAHPVGTAQRPGVILLDAKTTTNASDEAFANSVAKYGYDLQAAWYIHGYERVTGHKVYGFMLAVVESEFPHLTNSYLIEDDWLIDARAECDRLLTVYARCTLANDWPGYPKGTRYLNRPKWHVL